MSSTNLFDNSEAQRQVETSGKEEHNRQVGSSDARGRVTSSNTSAVNGPLGEQASPLRKQQEEEQHKNSVRQQARPLEGFPCTANANRTESLPSVLKNVFSDPSPSKGKIEAYIDAVYEQAMKERAIKQAIKHESDKRNKDLLDKNDSAGSFGDSKDTFRESGRRILDRRISDGRSSSYGPVTDNPQNTIVKFTNIGDCDFRKLKSREFNSQSLDHRSDGRSLIQGSVADDPRNRTAKLTKSEGEQGFAKMGGKGDNRKFLKLEKCDRLVNFSESGNREEMVRDRFRGVAQPENTFDYIPTSLAIHSSRIPEESQFSKRTQKDAFLNGDNTLLDNGSSPTTVEFFIQSGISFGNNPDGDINYDIASSTIKSDDLDENMFALLSKIIMSETRSSTESEERQYGFRAENISDNVNALRNASVVRKNLSAATIRKGNTRGEGREIKTENANVSTRISTVPAFTRLRNLSSSVGITRLEELFAPIAAVAARSENKSRTKILESKTRGSLPTNEIQGFRDDLRNLYKGRESRRMYNSPERTPKDVNLKNSYKFWKPRQKLRKGAEKFYGDKGIKEKLKRFRKSNRGLTRKRALSDFKRDSFRNEFLNRERRFRRHLQAGKEVFNIVDARNNGLTDEGSRRKTQAFMDYYTRPEIARSKRKMSNMGDSENPKKQVILESGHSYRKVQSEDSEEKRDDNPFYNNKDSKKNSVDKRIEDKFVRISNVLKEDSTETGIIQETSENFKVVTKSEVAKADIPKIQDELGDNLFSRENGKSDEMFAIHGDEITHEQPAELNYTHQGLTVKENSNATTETTINNKITTITSLIIKNSFDYNRSIFLKPIVNPFLPPSITRKLDYNITNKKIDFNKSKNSIYTTEFAVRQTEIFTEELSLNTPRGENVYFEVTDGPLGILSSNWTSSSKEVTKTLSNQSESEQNETENVRFLELNNNSSRIIAGNFIEPGLLSRGSTSITEPKEISLSEEGTGSRYTKDPLVKNSEDFLERSREKEEIAELVDRIVRQYAAFTPIMPGMPTFDEITEAEPLSLVEETTITQFTTTLATTTRLTDVAFRPSIHPLRTTPLPGEMHDEISLDETTFVDETEATTTHEKIVSKPRFRPGRPTNTSPKAKVRKVPNKTGKTGKRRQKITNRVTNMKMTKEEVEDHPWYQTTEVQQIIAANRSKSVQKTKGKRKKHRYKSETDYFQNISSAWTSSTVPSGVAQTRGKRSDFIRAAGNRDSFFYEREDEEARRSGRTGLNKNEKSPNITASTELRSTIEKRLADQLDYSASRGSPRHNCESQDQTQKLNTTLQDIAARNVGLRTVTDNLNSDAQEKERDMQDNLKSFNLLQLHHVKDDIIRKFDKAIFSRNREATSVSLGTLPSGPEKIPSSRTVRERLEIDQRSEKQAYGERMVAEVGGVAVVRKIAVNVSVGARTASASADDLSDRGAEPRERLSTGGILPTCARNPGDRDKSRETDTVIRGVKLMIPDDKGETRELDVAAKSVDKKIPPLFAARQQGREDARKINENPADCRVSAGKQYLRRPRGKVYDTVRKIINKLKGKLLSVSNETRTTKGSEKRVDRSPIDWQRSRRRLLSSGGSDYIESINDEYYANGESETDRENDSSDNEAIARRDDLSYLENQSGRREDRDPRKLVAGTDRLPDGNADVARVMTPEERTVAVCDAATLPDDMHANSEEAISRLLIPDINFDTNGILINAKIPILCSNQ